VDSGAPRWLPRVAPADSGGYAACSMKPYANRCGHSGVTGWEDGPGYLRLRFVDGGVYLYTHHRPGALKLATMKELARRGQGLATFINRHVRDDYECREN
jgi:hypothetical protein